MFIHFFYSINSYLHKLRYIFSHLSINYTYHVNYLLRKIFFYDFTIYHHHHHHHHQVVLLARISLTLSQPVSIVHRSRQVLKTTSCIDTELWYIDSSVSSSLCSFVYRGLLEFITYQFLLTSPAVTRMSGSSNLGSFRDGWYVAVQLLFWRVLHPGLVQYGSQHSCNWNC